MLNTLAIENYRSIRKLVLPLGPINLITGANGSGKSNLYRSLRLLAETASGGVGALLAREGGLRSALWAGPEQVSRRMLKGEVPVQGTVRSKTVRLKLGFMEEDFSYAISFGLPTPSRSFFALDPEIKNETIWVGERLRPAAVLVERSGAVLRARGEDGMAIVPMELDVHESMFSQVADPVGMPELIAIRDRVRQWRFYDHIRTDAEAPVRQSHIGTRTPVLHHDGRDLAAAVQTILEIGDQGLMEAAIDKAFPGSRLEVQVADDGRFSLGILQPGMLRPLAISELSDGTVRFLALVAALLSPRPPAMMVLNEPEMSLHPELLPALVDLIREVSKSTQVWVISHADAMIRTLSKAKGCSHVELEKTLGATGLSDTELMPSWSWPD